MARNHGPVCRLCRREGTKLFLKGSRCYAEKCAMERRPYAPGQHGQNRAKFSDYGLRLREKQKLKRIYGLLETQFRRFFEMASRRKGPTGENLLQLLERRLDNVVFRLGFATTRQEARQLVRHGHFLANGKKVNVPSYLVKIGEEISVRPKSQKVQRIVDAVGSAEARGVPEWAQLEKKDMVGKLNALPSREQLTVSLDIREQLIIELYSK